MTFLDKKINHKLLLELLRSLITFPEIYGSPYRFWLVTKLLVATSNPEDHEVVLNNPSLLTKHDVYDLLRAIGGDGIVTTADSKKVHTFLLQLLVLTFNSRKMASEQETHSVRLQFQNFAKFHPDFQRAISSVL